VLSRSTLVVLLSLVAGCLTVDGTLRADGTGTISLSYIAPPGATEASQRALLTAPGITVQSLTLGADRKFSAVLGVDDVAAIGKTPLFRAVTVTKAAQGDDQILTIKVVGQVRSVKDKSIAGPKIGITLPGKVAEANEGATVDGAHVAWSFTLADWLSRATWELTARYHPAAVGAENAGGGAEPAPSGAPKPAADAK
jgi:hypothetical protein